MNIADFKDLTIEYLSIDEINPYEKNPRRNDQAVEAVSQSLLRYGWRWPILIDKNNIIIAGHTRYKAAKKLGLKRIPCSRADDMPDELVKEFRLVDNKTGELAGWDFDLLNDELEAIGHSLEEFGFDADLNDININDFFDTPGSGRHQDRETNSESNADNGEHMQANDVNSKRIVTCPHCGEEFEV